MAGIGVIGCGYWGPNLIRNMAAIPGADLKMLCDLDQAKLDRQKAQYPYVDTTQNHKEMLARDDVEAVVIALVPELHYKLAKDCLEAGKHVMVEKPLAMNVAESQELVDIAEKNGLVLMAGHTFIYNSIVRKVKEYIDNGDVGDVYYIYSQRLNLGRIRDDVNVLWNLAPHDYSIIAYWMGTDPISIVARGFNFFRDGFCDTAFVTMEFPGGKAVNVHVSWLDPQKIRRMTIVGSKKMLIYDDVGFNKLSIYDKGYDVLTEEEKNMGMPETFGEFQLRQRKGDIIIPNIQFKEPLRTECEAFVDSIDKGVPNPSDGREGLRIVKWLEATQKSIDSGGKLVTLDSL